jgi:hypothetical protein
VARTVEMRQNLWTWPLDAPTDLGTLVDDCADVRGRDVALQGTFGGALPSVEKMGRTFRKNIPTSEKIKKYAYVVVAEHQPEIDGIPNMDIPHGFATRIDLCGSGVYLDKPPFSVPVRQLAETGCDTHSGRGSQIEPTAKCIHRLQGRLICLTQL